MTRESNGPPERVRVVLVRRGFERAHEYLLAESVLECREVLRYVSKERAVQALIHIAALMAGYFFSLWVVVVLAVMYVAQAGLDYAIVWLIDREIAQDGVDAPDIEEPKGENHDSTGRRSVGSP